MREIVFANARVVLADEVVHGSVAVSDGTITAIEPGAAVPPGAEDLGGDYLIPGLVELHTDHLESHFAPRPGVRWDPLAAVQAHDAEIAGCGITTVLDALRAGSDADAPGLGEAARTLAAAIRRGLAEDRLRADHLIHLRCEMSAPNVVEEVEHFATDPLVRLVSLMDHTPGQRQFASLAKYREYYQGKSGMNDAAMDAFIAVRLDNHARYGAATRERMVAFCRDAGFVVASHDDTTLEHVDEAVEAGAAIAEFPTTMTAAAAAREAGLKILMGAPNVVRGGSHSGNVSAGELAAAGLLDILSSDYVPISLLSAAFQLPEGGEAISLPAAIALVTRNPAAAVGLEDRGEITAGKRADLVRVRYDGDLPTVRGVWCIGRRVA